MKNTIIRYRQAIIALLLTVLGVAGAYASAPWTVNPSDYRYDMSLYLDVEFATNKMDYSLYEVGIFCGDECRGIAEVMPLNNGSSCLYARVRSNQESGETMTFKYYDVATGEVANVENVSFQFESNGRLGYPSDPYLVKIIRYFDLSISAGTGGYIDNTGGHLEEGSELTVTATADEGYHFLKWSDDSTENPRTITVEENLTLTAEFEANVYKLTYMLDNEEYDSVDVPYNSEITPLATPSKEGYTFHGWDGIPEKMPAYDVTATGYYTINSYTLTYKIGDEELWSTDVEYNSAIPPYDAPEKEGHTFAGWEDVPEKMPAQPVTIYGSYTVNKYKLIYKLDDQDYKSFDVDYGTTIILEADPEKEGYTFRGWDCPYETMPAFDVTVNGYYDINSYTLTYKIGEEVIWIGDVEYNSVITPENAPEKEGHTFAGWQDVPERMPANPVTIYGSYTVNKYKLIYKLDDKDYKSFDVDYGTTIIPEADPEKEGYTFGGWQGLPETMPADEVTVNGYFTINYYTLTYKIGEEVIWSTDVEYNSAIPPYDAPDKEGHTFAGWQNVPETMPAHNVTILGSYTVNKYKLTYKVGEEVYKEYDVDYGTAITAEAAPEKEGYRFSGWEGLPETMPANNVTVTGSFLINSYKLTFKIGEEVVDENMVEFGAEIVAPAAPEKEGHTFAGWQNVPEKMPAKDLVILGSYTVNQYKLTYKVGEEVYKEYDVDYGTAITAEAAPEKEGYRFSGWEGLPETMPANNVTVTGSFLINSYKLTFKIGEEVVDENMVEFGAKIVAPAAPDKEGHTFAGWQDVPEKMPAKDLVILGSYTVNKYKLIYKVGEEVYKEYDVDYGTAITAEAAPEKEGYRFSGWEGLPETMPANNVTVTGSFLINSYKLTFKIGEEVVEENMVEFGAEIVAPAAPDKEGHTFAGWQNVPEKMPANDLVILGSYTVNKYKLIYEVDGEVYKEYDVDYGTAITAEAAPEKEGYRFSGWEGLPETMPANNVTVTGSFLINSYKLTFKIGEEVIDEKLVEFGAEIVAPAAPDKEGHTFAGWENVPQTMPAKDLVILGSYTVNKYKLIYEVDGEVYKEYDVDYGTAITAEAAPEKEGYRFSGWEGLPETMPANNVTVTGSFLINSYKLTFKIGEEVVEEKMVEFGAEIVAPAAPDKEGHTFAGWQNVPQTMPAKDLVILGSYTVNKYKLTYMLEGEVYKVVEIPYGEEIDPEIPEKEGHTFAGWTDLPETMPARDVTVTGSFTVNKYKLNLYLNDELYSTTEVEFGAKIVIEDPKVPEGNKFDGWKDEIPETMPAHDIDIHGTYSLVNYIATIYISQDENVTIYTINGALICRDKKWSEISDRLVDGVYIINRQKVVFRSK